MRRGQTSPEPGGAVVKFALFAVVTLIIIALIVTPFLGKSEGGISAKTCQASLILTRAQNLAHPVCISDKPSFIPLLCERSFLRLEGSEVQKDEKRVAEDYGPECPDGSQGCLGHSVLAEEMRKCWDLFGEGELVVFQQGEINEQRFWERKDTARSCFVCAEVALDRPVQGFSSYLKETKMPRGNASYYDFLARNPRQWCDESLIPSRGETCFEGIAQERGERTVLERILNLQEEVPAFFAGKAPGTIPQDDLPAETYAVTFIRRGMSTCEGDQALEDRLDITKDYLTFSVQAIPAKDIYNQCEVVLS